jgi:PIN domain nuclease of toxin-antitoxin system
MILLDTHVMVWLLVDPERLSEPAREAILQARATGEPIAYSPVSLYEIAYATQRKRLHLTRTTKDFIAAIESRLIEIPLSSAIARCAAELPSHFHRDPMDHIITASAIVTECALVTRDERVRRANVCKTFW